MNNCPLCLSNYSASTSLCDNCGFSFERGEISDHGRLRAYLDKLRKSHKWSEEVNLKKRITEYFISKYGRSLPSADSQGWSERKTARLLGETNTHTSNDIRLAKALDKYPELSNYKSKTQAKRRLKQILSLSDYSVIEHEKDLQKYLNTNWVKTPFGLSGNCKRHQEKVDMIRERLVK